MPDTSKLDSSRSEWTIGRARDCDIVIDRPSVSGRHALLRRGDDGQVTLVDLDSRNGIHADAAGGEKISSVVLRSGQSVYFGSHRVEVDSLLNRLPDSANAGKVVNPAKRRPSQTDPKASISVRSGETGKSGVMFGWLVGAIASIGLVSGFLWLRTNVRTDAIDSPPVRIVQSATVESIGATESSDRAVLLDPNSASLVQTNQRSPIEESVYWFAVRHAATGNVFRLGSGIAIREDKIAVPASLVETANSLMGQGFESPVVIHISDGVTFAVADQQTAPKYGLASQNVAQRTTDHDAVIKKIETGTLPKADAKLEFEKSIATLDRSIQAQKAVDMGWLKIETLAEHYATSSERDLRPGQSVDVLRSNLEMDDPFWESKGASDFKFVKFKIRYIAADADGVSGALILTTDVIELDYNWLGAPIVRDGQLVGMIVDQPPPTTTSTNPESQPSQASWFAITYPSMDRLLETKP